MNQVCCCGQHDTSDARAVESASAEHTWRYGCDSVHGRCYLNLPSGSIFVDTVCSSQEPNLLTELRVMKQMFSHRGKAMAGACMVCGD